MKKYFYRMPRNSSVQKTVGVHDRDVSKSCLLFDQFQLQLSAEPDAAITNAELYTAYCDLVTSHGLTPSSKQLLGKTMRAHGYNQVEVNRRRGYKLRVRVQQ